MIAIDLSKQEALDLDPRAIKQINFTTILDRAETQESFSFLKKQKKLFWTFCQGLQKYCKCLIE